MWGYRNRIDRDLKRWREAGWIDHGSEAAIRADLKANSYGIGLAGALAILAAVLIGFAVMSFVAANWQAMPKVLRLTMLFGLLWVSYGMAGTLFERARQLAGEGPQERSARAMTAFAHAAVLVGAGVFGASIMLISQMYHMDGNPPDAVLVWAAGALLAGVVFRSNPSLAFALVLFSIWGIMETSSSLDVFWPYLLAWGATSATFYWQKWPAGAHLSGVGLTGFLITMGSVWHNQSGYEIMLLSGIALAALAAFGLKAFPKLDTIWRPALSYAFVVAFAGFLALQFVRNPSLAAFVVLAALALCLTLLAIWWGLAAPDRLTLWLGYIGFSIEILAIYSKTIGTLMGSSLFFLSAGLIVAGLAWLAYRLHARQDYSEVVS